MEGFPRGVHSHDVTAWHCMALHAVFECLPAGLHRSCRAASTFAPCRARFDVHTLPAVGSASMWWSGRGPLQRARPLRHLAKRKMRPSILTAMATASVLSCAPRPSSSRLILDAPLDTLAEACQIVNGRHPSHTNCSKIFMASTTCVESWPVEREHLTQTLTPCPAGRRGTCTEFGVRWCENTVFPQKGGCYRSGAWPSVFSSGERSCAQCTTLVWSCSWRVRWCIAASTDTPRITHAANRWPLTLRVRARWPDGLRGVLVRLFDLPA